MGTYKTLIQRFRKLYGKTPAIEFGPRKLKALRQALVDEGLSRGVVNRTISRVRQIFTWGAENELVPASIVEALRCVAGLRYGKTTTDPVRLVPVAYVDTVLPHVAPQVRAMIELQRVTGMRSGEICRIAGKTQGAGLIGNHDLSIERYQKRVVLLKDSAPRGDRSRIGTSSAGLMDIPA